MIYGKVGRLGHGKSMRMVVEGIDLCRLRGGLEDPPRCWLASNIRVNAPPGMVFRQLPMVQFSEAVADLLAETRALQIGLVLLVDEIDEVWGAADWQDVSRGDRHRIKQSRKYGADLIWTAQFVDQVEKSIRNITEEVGLCRAYPSPTIARRESGKRPLLIREQRYRPAAVRELNAEQDRDKRLGAKWHRYRREHEGLYDTDEIIVPPRPEQLCARHRREITEARCPMCHPPVHVSGLAEVVAIASQSRPDGRQAVR
jgi:hypothetical protein